MAINDSEVNSDGQKAQDKQQIEIRELIKALIRSHKQAISLMEKILAA